MTLGAPQQTENLRPERLGKPLAAGEVGNHLAQARARHELELEKLRRAQPEGKRRS